MSDKNLEKALDIIGVLMEGKQISKSMYDEYISNGEIYDYVEMICKKFNLDVYEHGNGLYMCAGYNNSLFGYSHEELKKEMGIKLNRELYMCYFITYTIIAGFYKDSATYNYVEYVKLEDIITNVDNMLKGIVNGLKLMMLEEVEENSFKTIALMWEDLPMVVNEETTLRAARGSKKGFAKLTLNFLLTRDLLVETEGRYYPTDRFRAYIENYFEKYKGRIFEIMKGDTQDATY